MYTLIQSGKTNVKYILILIILSVIVGGGMIFLSRTLKIATDIPTISQTICAKDSDCRSSCGCGCINKSENCPGDELKECDGYPCQCINNKCTKDETAKEDEEVIKKSETESQCQIILRKGATDKTKREQSYPTIEGESIISLKFREGSEVRLRNGKFVSLCGEDLSQINNLINNYPNISIQRLISLSEEELAEEYNKLKQNNPDIADFNLWYRIIFPEDTSIETVDSLINKLNEFYIIDIAYPEPLSAPPPG